MSKWILWNKTSSFGPVALSFASMPCKDGNIIYGTADNPYTKLTLIRANGTEPTKVFGYYSTDGGVTQTKSSALPTSSLLRIISNVSLNLGETSVQYNEELISGVYHLKENAIFPVNFPKDIFIGVKFTVPEGNTKEKFIGIQVTEDKINFVKRDLTIVQVASFNNDAWTIENITNIDFHVKQQEVPSFFADLFDEENGIFECGVQYPVQKNVLLMQNIDGKETAIFPKVYVSGLMNDDGTQWKEPEANLGANAEYKLDYNHVLKNIKIKGEVFKAPSVSDILEEVEDF